MDKSFVIKGNICQTVNPRELNLHERDFTVCVDGISKGIYVAGRKIIQKGYVSNA